MGRRKAQEQPTPKRKRSYRSPEEQEHQMISLAMQLAERQLLDGTASSQVISHFLKLGTAKEMLEREKLERENKVLSAKAEAFESSKRVEEMYEKALDAMRLYGGVTSEK